MPDYKTGEPITCPRWYQYLNDTQTYLIDDVYIVGNHILVAPVVEEGMTTRGIYLPKIPSGSTGRRASASKAENYVTCKRHSTAS